MTPMTRLIKFFIWRFSSCIKLLQWCKLRHLSERNILFIKSQLFCWILLIHFVNSQPFATKSQVYFYLISLPTWLINKTVTFPSAKVRNATLPGPETNFGLLFRPTSTLKYQNMSKYHCIDVFSGLINEGEWQMSERLRKDKNKSIIIYGSAVGSLFTYL